jgi:hypothetical protein
MIVKRLILIAAASTWALPGLPAGQAVLSGTPPGESQGRFDEYVIRIPEQTLSPWRGEPGAADEGRRLEDYLKVLVWGRDGVHAAEAEGRSITVESGGIVVVRDTPENAERVRREINPSLQSMVRRHTARQGVVAQTGPNTWVSDPSARIGPIRVVGRDALPAGGPGTVTAPGATSTTARRTLRQDDEMTFRGLRLTLLDVVYDTDNNRLQAAIKAEMPPTTSELEIYENRSATFEGFRIRVLQATATPQQQVTVEVTDER